MITDCDGSLGFGQMAASSAASPECNTGSVSATAVAMSPDGGGGGVVSAWSSRITNASSSSPRYWSGSLTVTPFEPIKYGLVLLMDPIGPLPCATVMPSTSTLTVLPTRLHTT